MWRYLARWNCCISSSPFEHLHLLLEGAVLVLSLATARLRGLGLHLAAGHSTDDLIVSFSDWQNQSHQRGHDDPGLRLVLVVSNIYRSLVALYREVRSNHASL